MALTDSQYITGDLFDPVLLWITPNEIFDGMNEYNNKAYVPYSYHQVGSDRFGPIYEEIFLVNKYRLMLINNTYDMNFAGNKRSIVNTEGFMIVQSIGEVY